MCYIRARRSLRAVSRTRFQSVVMSKFVLVRSIAAFNGGFLDFNRVSVASTMKLLMNSSRLMFIFENFLIEAFALQSGGGRGNRCQSR